MDPIKKTERPFLEVGCNMKTSESDDDYSLLDKAMSELLNPISSATKTISPKPGFCVKAKTEDDRKIFINVCHHPDMPFPSELENVITLFHERKLEKVLNPFPFSLGGPHAEIDKNGALCDCFDVVVNTDCFKKTEDLFYRDIIMSLSVAGIENKFGISIDIDSCKVLKKKYHGIIEPQFIRSKTVEELKTVPPEMAKNDELVFPFSVKPKQESPQYSEVKRTNLQASTEFATNLHTDNLAATYRLFQVPSSGPPSTLTFQALMPTVQTSRNILVRVSKSSLVIRQRLCKEVIDIALPFMVLPEKSLANFFEGKLVVVMPIASQ